MLLKGLCHKNKYGFLFSYFSIWSGPPGSNDGQNWRSKILFDCPFQLIVHELQNSFQAHLLSQSQLHKRIMGFFMPVVQWPGPVELIYLPPLDRNCWVSIALFVNFCIRNLWMLYYLTLIGMALVFEDQLLFKLLLKHDAFCKVYFFLKYAMKLPDNS